MSKRGRDFARAVAGDLDGINAEHFGGGIAAMRRDVATRWLRFNASGVLTDSKR